MALYCHVYVANYEESTEHFEETTIFKQLGNFIINCQNKLYFYFKLSKADILTVFCDGTFKFSVFKTMFCTRQKTVQEDKNHNPLN